MFKNVLVPIDVAEIAIAEPGVQFAARLAAWTNGSVRLIHVLSEAIERLSEFLPVELQVDRREDARAAMLEIVNKADAPRGLFSVTIRTGAVYHEVLAEAESWGADLIIIGSHSPSMSTYLLGSNAQNIVRNANCSVMVIRPHKDEHGAYWLVPRNGS